MSANSRRGMWRGRHHRLCACVVVVILGAALAVV